MIFTDIHERLFLDDVTLRRFHSPNFFMNQIFDFEIGIDMICQYSADAIEVQCGKCVFFPKRKVRQKINLL